MKIITAAEMRATDQRTAENHGIPSLTLMENAGRAVASFVLSKYPSAARISVLCGRGNNGGDGFMAASVLKAAGRDVTVVVLGDPAGIQGDAKKMYDNLIAPCLVLNADADVTAEPFNQVVLRTDLFIDAVVGTGFQPPLRGLAATMHARLQSLQQPVVAVDLPSGWDADSRASSAEGAYRADSVITFTSPKAAHVFGNLTRGSLVVVPIGSPPQAVESETRLTWAGASKHIVDTPRPPDSNKGRFGHVLVIGGAKGTAGAPAMCALAALRTGAGLVTAAVPESVLPIVACVTPELMTFPLNEGHHGEISCRNLEAGNLHPLLEKKTVLAIGPGISQHPEAFKFALGLIQETKLPIVIDADALNALAANPDILSQLNPSGKRTVVLTPHPGEMGRLVQRSVAEVEANREEIARGFAIRHQVTLVLKGWRTLIAHPDGAIAVNTSGNPAMAKGGSGDILTGIIAAMLAQYPQQVADAVNTAVYLHGLAADFALSEQNEHTLLATDTINHLFKAFRFPSATEDGYVWLQGMPASPVRQS